LEPTLLIKGHVVIATIKDSFITATAFTKIDNMCHQSFPMAPISMLGIDDHVFDVSHITGFRVPFLFDEDFNGPDYGAIYFVHEDVIVAGQMFE
jgi:hypothetical protein